MLISDVRSTSMTLSSMEVSTLVEGSSVLEGLGSRLTVPLLTFTLNISSLTISSQKHGPYQSGVVLMSGLQACLSLTWVVVLVVWEQDQAQR